MFTDGNFDVLEFTPPSHGMNCNIAPEVLPKQFASFLENILPIPLGEGTVRHGTKRLVGMNLPADSVIMEAFPFNKANGDTQMVLYVQTFVQDDTANTFSVLTSNSFSFNTANLNTFNLDTPIKIEYTHHGAQTLYSQIIGKTTLNNTVTITVRENSFPEPVRDDFPFPDNAEINRVAFSQGSLYVYDLQTHTLSNPLRAGLSVGCVPRSVTFLNTLVICNGVDKVLSWDGTDLTEVVDFVKEDTATTFARINDTSFSFNLVPMKATKFDITKYQNTNQIQLKVLGIPTAITTVTNIQRNLNVVTITTGDNLPAFDQQHQPEMFYRDWPPAFSFLMVAHNRLWGLGVGAAGLNYRNPDQSMIVYCSYASNSITDWFNENTKSVPSFNLSKTHGAPDNLEAIAFLNGNLVFLGRNHVQVWTGSEPTGAAPPAPNRPPFEFSTSLPIGIVHGNLLVQMANDIYFVSQNGLLSFSTLNVAKQFAASASDAVDPLVKQYVTSTTTSNQAYRACRSFKYKSGGFCGFKIGLNKMLVSLYSTNLYAWSVFSGNFARAQSFLTNLNNAMYLLINNNIYQYADGTTDGLPVYIDEYGNGIATTKEMINFLWQAPVTSLRGKRFANKRYEIQCDYPSSFVINSNNKLCIMIAGDLRKTFTLEHNYNLQFKGDVLLQVPLIAPADIGGDPNQPKPNAIGFRLHEPYTFTKGRLRFASSNFTVNILGCALNGPLTIKKIRLFGIAERNT